MIISRRAEQLDPSKPGVVTVSANPSLDVPRGTLNSILKQAGLKERGDNQR